MFKANGRCTPPNMHPVYLVLTTHLMCLTMPYPYKLGYWSQRDFFYLFSKDFFFDSCISSSSKLIQISISKEPSETLDASTTFDFPVSVCNSNLFCVTGLLECLCCWRRPTCFCNGFWVLSLRSLGFVPGGSKNFQGRFLSRFEGFFFVWLY